MRVLLAQLTPVPGDVERNADQVVRALAARPDADLAVFSELFLTGYDLGTVAGLAIPVTSPALERVREAAHDHGTAVVVGFPERHPGGVANAAACVDADGSLAGVYRKTHLFGAEHAAFVAGDELLVVELAGRRVAPLICFDVEFPEPARAVAQAGAELLVTLAANMDPYGPDHAVQVRARAIDNRRPHVYVNRPGTEAGLTFAGASFAVDAGGAVPAGLGREPGTAVADLAFSAAFDDAVDYLAHVRAGLPVTAVPSAISQGATT